MSPTLDTTRWRTRSTLAITIENAKETLEWQPEYSILICRDHGYAIGSVAHHLRIYHSGTDNDKKAVVDLFSEHVLCSPKDVLLPPPLEQPFDALKKPQKGFICNEPECERITVSRDEIRKHCNRDHYWKSSKEEREHWHQVWVQTFFISAGLQKYFTVQHDEHDSTSDGEAPYEGDTRATTTIAQQAEDSNVAAEMEEWDKFESQHKEALQVADAEVAKTDNTGWYKRTEWATHLAKCNLRHLTVSTME